MKKYTELELPYFQFRMKFVAVFCIVHISSGVLYLSGCYTCLQFSLLPYSSLISLSLCLLYEVAVLQSQCFSLS